MLTDGTTPGGLLRRWRGQRGFTLIELLVVIALITILATMGMVQYRNSMPERARGDLKTDLFHMRDAIDQYYADKSKYPASLDALVTDDYMRKVPEDPISKSADTWQTDAGGAGPEPIPPPSPASTTSRAAPRARRSMAPPTRISRDSFQLSADSCQSWRPGRPCALRRTGVQPDGGSAMMAPQS